MTRVKGEPAHEIMITALTIIPRNISLPVRYRQITDPFEWFLEDFPRGGVEHSTRDCRKRRAAGRAGSHWYGGIQICKEERREGFLTRCLY